MPALLPASVYAKVTMQMLADLSKYQCALFSQCAPLFLCLVQSLCDLLVWCFCDCATAGRGRLLYVGDRHVVTDTLCLCTPYQKAPLTFTDPCEKLARTQSHRIEAWANDSFETERPSGCLGHALMLESYVGHQ